jgi:hypothetical protein
MIIFPLRMGLITSEWFFMQEDKTSKKPAASIGFRINL